MLRCEDVFSLDCTDLNRIISRVLNEHWWRLNSSTDGLSQNKWRRRVMDVTLKHMRSAVLINLCSLWSTVFIKKISAAETLTSLSLFPSPSPALSDVSHLANIWIVNAGEVICRLTATRLHLHSCHPLVLKRCSSLTPESAMTWIYFSHAGRCFSLFSVCLFCSGLPLNVTS